MKEEKKLVERKLIVREDDEIRLMTTFCKLNLLEKFFGEVSEGEIEIEKYSPVINGIHYTLGEMKEDVETVLVNLGRW
jgi:hypothetical protein